MLIYQNHRDKHHYNPTQNHINKQFKMATFKSTSTPSKRITNNQLKRNNTTKTGQNKITHSQFV
jgi:hypothetical protein